MIKQNVNISKNKPLSGTSYIQLPKELYHSRKGLSIADHHSTRIRKIDREFAENLILKT